MKKKAVRFAPDRRASAMKKGASSYLFVPPRVTGVQLEESCPRLLITAYGMPPAYLQDELTRPANALRQNGACA